MNRPQKKLNLWYDSFPKMLYWWTLLFRAIRDTKLTSITFLLISMLFTLVFTSELLLKNFICSDTPCNQRTPSFVMIRKSFYIESNACSWCDVNFVNMICFVTMMLNDFKQLLMSSTVASEFFVIDLILYFIFSAVIRLGFSLLQT
jgi:hypothetical protein